MAVALCVHSLLEGAALGAQREIAKTFHIFVAILAHKVHLLPGCCLDMQEGTGSTQARTDGLAAEHAGLA